MNKLVAIALKYIGTNPGNWTFPWCAAFLDKILNEAEIEHETTLLARSFLKVGESTNTPAMGDIAILWRVRYDSQWGHCGLYIAENENEIFILGGNQDNTVKIKAYPKWQLLDIRKLHD